ncbi:hypothetical protein BDY24DRAFT_389585, partial [Mrakia frigida]|uniref:uncharacterized protein n=1 Tax=Mrakia frigida TaxID=29902 RepID=UPI003FCBF44E
MDDEGTAYHLAEARLRSKAGKKVLSARQTALEKLKVVKAVKAGRANKRKVRHSPADSLFDGSSAASSETASSSSSSSSSQSDDVEASAWIEGRRSSDDSDGETSDSNATDFVTDDDEAALNAKSQIPEQYQVSLTINQCFEICVQYHIFLIINGRAWIRDSPSEAYFQKALTKIRAHMVDRRNLHVTSQIWPASFTDVLSKYPHWQEDRIKQDELPPCDACRNLNKPAKLWVRVGGREYDRETFEDVEKDDSRSESGSETESEKAEEQDKQFNCGINCAARALLHHKMSHWEYNLHTTLKLEIAQLPVESDDENGRPKPTKANRRPAPSSRLPRPPKRDGNRVNAYLVRRGFVASEYKKFTEIMDTDADKWRRPDV